MCIDQISWQNVVSHQTRTTCCCGYEKRSFEVGVSLLVSIVVTKWISIIQLFVDLLQSRPLAMQLACEWIWVTMLNLTCTTIIYNIDAWLDIIACTLSSRKYKENTYCMISWLPYYLSILHYTASLNYLPEVPITCRSTIPIGPNTV